MKIFNLKSAVIFTVCFTAILASGCDQGSIFNAKQMHTDATARIESAGWDMRIYEFTPQTNQNIQCVFVTGDRKGGLYCFQKEN